MRTSNKCSPQGDAGTIDTGGAGMGGVAGILGTDAAATIFLLKSVYAFLAPLSFALALPLPLSDVSALDTREIEGERLRPLLILIYLLFGRQKRA